MLDFTNADKLLRSVLAFQSAPNAKATLETCPKCGFDMTDGPAECNIIGHNSDILPGKGHVCGISIIGDDIQYDPSKENGGVENCVVIGRATKLIIGRRLMGCPSNLFMDLRGRYPECWK